MGVLHLRGLSKSTTIAAAILALTASLIIIMTPWLYSLATVGFALTRPVGAATTASKEDTTWYAPAPRDVNNLTKALNSKGVYGFIFDTSDTPDDEYGTYNYCNMPHVRRQEYVKPSQEYELQYVELMHRHHKRTPYASNAFPTESYQWNCDDQGLYYYGRPFDGPDAAKSYRKGVISAINPFVPSGWIGSCQFPQITPGGLDDSWQHGADLYGVYHDLLHFLPSKHAAGYSDKVTYRVTNNVITSQVAGMVINGMWGTTDDFPLQVQAEGVDSLEPQFSCSKGSSLWSSIKSSSNSAWKKHLDDAKEIYATLDDISGVSTGDSGFHMSFDHYFDNLSSRQCHNKPLPCKLVDGANSTTCITQEMADTVYRLGHWEYSQIYRDHKYSLPASASSYGVWPAELAVHLREVMDGKRDTIYFHNVAHDGSVSRLLSLLQIDEMVWPGMGAEVVFELYKKRAGSSEPEPTKEAVAPSCSHNNCLRQMIRHSSSASALCPSFTASTASAVPTWPSACRDAKQVSSACSCLVPSSTTSAAASSATATPSESGYNVRVLFGGQVFKSSSPTLGKIDMIPVETLLSYLDALVGEKATLVKGSCAS